MPGSTNLLKQLIIDKYGNEKISTGILLVMRWLNAITASHFSYDDLNKKVAQKNTPFFTRPQKEALRKLFGKDYDKNLATLPDLSDATKTKSSVFEPSYLF